MNTAPAPTSYRVLIGLDWGDTQHALSLLPPEGPIERSTLQQTPADLQRWFKELQCRFPDTQIAVAVETTKGPLINALLTQSFLTLYPIHPATSARYRKAFRPSGAKDDAPDADVLLDLLRQHLAKLRPLHVEDPATRKLAGLVEARRQAVDRRTQLVNTLKNRLKGYYPLALKLGGEDLYAPLMLDLLTRWPDLLQLKAAKPATLKKFFYDHNLRRPEHVKGRLEQIAAAVPLTSDEAVLSVAVAEVQAWVEQLRVMQKHIALFETQIAAAFKAHPEAELFRELPGAGPALAPRLLVAFGTDRTRFPNAASLQKSSGVAPVREKSGTRSWIHWRWHAPKFLRQTFHEWAGQTVVWCDWAKEFYNRQKKAGKGHHAILRALAFKWQRILWKCWQSRTPYQEHLYLAARLKQRSATTP
jgi:transposase